MRRRLPARSALALWCAALVLASGALVTVLTVALAEQRLRAAAAHPPPAPAGAPVPPPPLLEQELQRLADAQGRLAGAALDEVRVTALVVLAGLAVLSVVVGWWAAGRMLRPLSLLRVTARAVSGESLTRRIHLGGPHDELRDLADTVDDMLDRLQVSLSAHERFSAEVAHELRTRLAVVQAEVEVVLDDPANTATEFRDALTVIGAETQRLHLVTESMLALSRAQVLTRTVPTDVADAVARELPGVLARTATNREVRSDVREAPVCGDPVMIDTMVRNLLDNAARYNRPGGLVAVTCGRDQAGVQLTVANDGPVIGQGEVDGLFEPFLRRVDVPAATGSGLGLAIVATVVRAHHGSVRARPRPGGGLDVVVRLPAVPSR